MAIVEELLDVFKRAAGVDDKRPIMHDTERGVHMYSDANREYNLLIPELKRGVSTVESFAQVVKEESRRRDNSAGDFMTAVFTQKGGVFYPDDKKRLDQWTYERTLSQQWEYLLQRLGRDMKHLEFVRFLQGLRPSVQDYSLLMRDYKKVTFDGKTRVSSQPVIENGQGGSQVSFVLETKNGTTEEAMPGAFVLELPFTKGGAKTYQLTIELDVALDENQQVKFRPVCPDLEAVTEEAISDEVAYFKEHVAEMSELLVLLDY